MINQWNVFYSLKVASYCLSVGKRLGTVTKLITIFSAATLAAAARAEDLQVKLMSAKEAKSIPFVVEKPRRKIKVTVKPVAKLKSLVVKNEPPPRPEVICPSRGFKKSLLIHHIPVGDGDATFMRTPSGVTVLVGAGPVVPAKAPNPVVEVLQKCYQLKDIDYVVVNGFEDHHIGGLSDVLKKYRVRKAILEPGQRLVTKPAKIAKTPLEKYFKFAALSKRKTPIPGEVEIKNSDNINFQFVESGQALAFVVRFGTFDYFVGGDKTDENQVADLVGDVDIFRANKRGDPAINSQIFAETLSPEQVIISNSMVFYDDHPLQKRLESISSVRNVFQTSQIRDVIILADITSYRIGDDLFQTDGLEGSGLVTESLAAESSLPKPSLTGEPTQKYSADAPAKAEPEPLEEPDMEALEY